MNGRRGSGKTLIAVVAGIVILIGGGMLLQRFISERIFLSRFKAVATEQQDNNRIFFQNVGKLGETTGATTESLVVAYAALLRTRIEDIRSGVDKAKALSAPSSKAAVVKDGFIEIMLETIKMNETALSAAVEGDFDKVVRIETDNEKKIQPMLQAYFGKLKAAGIHIPDADQTIDKAIEQANEQRG